MVSCHSPAESYFLSVVVDCFCLDDKLHISIHLVRFSCVACVCIFVRTKCIQTIQNILKIIVHNIWYLLDSFIVEFFCSVRQFLCSFCKCIDSALDLCASTYQSSCTTCELLCTTCELSCSACKLACSAVQCSTVSRKFFGPACQSACCTVDLTCSALYLFACTCKLICSTCQSLAWLLKLVLLKTMPF